MASATYSGVTIGVLELQGDFAEHTAMLRACGVGRVVGIRQPTDLDGCPVDGLVIPGGESTTMAKLLVEQDMLPAIQALGRDKALPMFGTCAGCILLAREIRQRPQQPRIGVLDVAVDRNAYGAQIDSFEAHIDFNGDGDKGTDEPLRVVHIRAPIIAEVLSGKVEVIARYNEHPILVKQGNVMACTFHPELTTDTRVHKMFLDTVLSYKQST